MRQVEMRLRSHEDPNAHCQPLVLVGALVREILSKSRLRPYSPRQYSLELLMFLGREFHKM
jgi:hypothetical protein